MFPSPALLLPEGDALPVGKEAGEFQHAVRVDQPRVALDGIEVVQPGAFPEAGGGRVRREAPVRDDEAVPDVVLADERLVRGQVEHVPREAL